MSSLRSIMFILFLVPLLVISAWTPSDALEPWRLYDDFEVGPISFSKWYGESSDDSHIYAMDRTLVLDPSGVGRDLRLMHVGHGASNDNSGEEETSVGLAFAAPETVTAIRAKFNVRNYTTTACAANANSSADANVAIVGNFFNVDQGTKKPGDHTGDVRAAVAVGASTSNFNDAGTQLHVFGIVEKCGDSKCSWQNAIFLSNTNNDYTDLGTVSLGSWVRVAVQWDQANRQFLFQRGTQTPVAVSYASLTIPNLGLPAVNLKRITTLNFSANCMSPNSPATTKMDALVDNVAVNQTALP